MDIALFFDSLKEDLVEGLGVNDLGSSFHVNASSIPSLEGKLLALYTVVQNPEESMDTFRKELYRLKKTNISYQIVDLGVLRPADTFEDTCERIKEVNSFLMDRGMIPIVLSDYHGFDKGQYDAFEHLDTHINYTCIDHSFDLLEGNNHLYQNLINDKVILDQYTHLAYQAYLTDIDSLKIFEKLNFESYRLGQVKDELKEIEPSIRKTHCLSFDLSSIKGSDVRGVNVNMPFGLTSEEAAQISWYTGLSDNMQSIGLYGYVPSKDEFNITAKTIATMVWYFIEGVSHRKDSYNFEDGDYLKYIVFLDQTGEELIFYKNVRSEKWWLKVDKDVIPCSYKDYKLASSGEIPDRWLNEIVRRS